MMLGLAASGCSRPALEAVTSLAGRTCAMAPDLTAARPIEFDVADTNRVDLDATGPCLGGAGGPSLYATFQLPNVPAPYVVNIASERRRQTVASLRLTLLDAQGGETRTVPRASFVQRGQELTSTLRVRPGERYLVVASDPATVGQQSRDITSATQTQAVGYPLLVQVNTGSEEVTSTRYAHNGTIRVAARPLPRAE